MTPEFRCPECGNADAKEFSFSFAVSGDANGYTAGLTEQGAVILNHPMNTTHRSSEKTDFRCLKCQHVWTDDCPTVVRT